MLLISPHSCRSWDIGLFVFFSSCVNLLAREVSISWHHEIPKHETNTHFVKYFQMYKECDVETWLIEGILKEKNFSVKITQKMWSGK